MLSASSACSALIVLAANKKGGAIWIGVTGGAEALVDLQHEMARRVAAAGVTLETRPFRPHVTVGRWRHSRPSDRRGALAAATSLVLARTTVARATLYHSRPSPAGSTYTALAHATLSGG